jgi:hypothetical protein
MFVVLLKIETIRWGCLEGGATIRMFLVTFGKRYTVYKLYIISVNNSD